MGKKRKIQGVVEAKKVDLPLEIRRRRNEEYRDRMVESRNHDKVDTEYTERYESNIIAGTAGTLLVFRWEHRHHR